MSHSGVEDSVRGKQPRGNSMKNECALANVANMNLNTARGGAAHPGSFIPEKVKAAVPALFSVLEGCNYYFLSPQALDLASSRSGSSRNWQKRCKSSFICGFLRCLPEHLSAFRL